MGSNPIVASQQNGLASCDASPFALPKVVKVGRVGVEPTRPLGHRFLRPTRMPFRHRPNEKDVTPAA
jgi:hypothetical protein